MAAVWPGFWNLPDGDKNEVGGYMLFRCVICHFDVQFDDVAVPAAHHEAAQCICVKCYRRETDSEKPMDKRLRGQLMQTLDAMDRGV